jgi:LPS export ABC transporter protein LptC
MTRKRSVWLIVLSTFIFAGCDNDLETINRVGSKNTLPVETGKNVFVNYTDSGFPRARIFAPLMERYATDDKNYTEMRGGITAYFFNRQHKVDSYLKSKYAIRYDRERKTVVRNDVVLVNNKGDTLNTEELTWNEVTQRINTDKYVRITTPDEIIMGDGLESNTEFTQYRIFKIRGTISLRQ